MVPGVTGNRIKKWMREDESVARRGEESDIRCFAFLLKLKKKTGTRIGVDVMERGFHGRLHAEKEERERKKQRDYREYDLIMRFAFLFAFLQLVLLSLCVTIAPILRSSTVCLLPSPQISSLRHALCSKFRLFICVASGMPHSLIRWCVIKDVPFFFATQPSSSSPSTSSPSFAACLSSRVLR